jgi:hypothetical protein
VPDLGRIHTVPVRTLAGREQVVDGAARTPSAVAAVVAPLLGIPAALRVGAQAEQVDDGVRGLFHAGQCGLGRAAACALRPPATAPTTVENLEGPGQRSDQGLRAYPPGTRTQNLRIKRPIPVISSSVDTCPELRICTCVRPPRCTESRALHSVCLRDKHLTAVANTGTG